MKKLKLKTDRNLSENPKKKGNQRVAMNAANHKAWEVVYAVCRWVCSQKGNRPFRSLSCLLLQSLIVWEKVCIPKANCSTKGSTTKMRALMVKKEKCVHGGCVFSQCWQNEFSLACRLTCLGEWKPPSSQMCFPLSTALLLFLRGLLHSQIWVGSPPPLAIPALPLAGPACCLPIHQHAPG